MSEQAAESVEFTPDQIDRLGRWLSECLDDAAPLNERLWRSRAEWMVKGPTFQSVMREIVRAPGHPADHTPRAEQGGES